MIKIKLEKQSYIILDGIKFVNGINEIPEEKYEKLKENPSFQAQISSGNLSVHEEVKQKKPIEDESRHSDKMHKNETHDDKKHNAPHHETHDENLSLKDLLKVIHTTEDCDFLVDLASNHGKDKIREAAKTRLDQLNIEDYKQENKK